ncbi:hypothetical protein K0M31_011955 [Melipona bicolor]|uniref:Uncharacterized protein n=1 Tax=Melipona bicolor TaxID=60889 RepID=A0AA40GAJ2_9HYME|nr:hypothetical protein K0M31_011955 [Melipona bicolor]
MQEADLGHPNPRRFEDTPSRCATTSTSNGVINLNADSDEEWLTYEKLTEIAFSRSRTKSPAPPAANVALRDNQSKSADIERRQSVKLTKSNSVASKVEAQPVIFDERADGDKAARDASPLPIRKSLFPYVSPYVLFQSHDHVPETLPKDFAQLLKWKFTTSTPRILMKILINSGYQVVNKGNDWFGVWNLSCKDTARYRSMKNFQKVKIGRETFLKRKQVCTFIVVNYIENYLSQLNVYFNCFILFLFF